MEKIKCDPELFSLRGVRRIAMKRAWALVDEQEKAGKPSMVGDFGKAIKQAYEDVKEAQRRCPIPNRK